VRVAGPGLVTLDGQARTLVSAAPHEQWLGIGWTVVRPADRYRRPQAPQPVHPLVEVSARELRARVAIDVLSADGDRVAYWLCPHILGAWRPGDAQQVALGQASVEACAPSPGTDLPAYDLALAGDRLAYLTSWAGNEVHWTFMLTSLDRGDEGLAIATGAQVEPRRPLVGDIVGGGSTLVYGSVSASLPESIWRLDGWTPAQIARRSDDLQPVAVDRDRIVARRADGALDLLGVDGGVLETFAVPSLGAALAGDDLVVLVQAELRDYSVSTGALLHTWPLPDVPSAGRCRLPACYGIRLTLDDAAPGIALYTLDGVVHLLRLRDGDDSTLPGATAAELTEAGLFYAYRGEDPRPGRIRFVPLEELTR
jgi:hypothetical protein